MFGSCTEARRLPATRERGKVFDNERRVTFFRRVVANFRGYKLFVPSCSISHQHGFALIA